MKSFTAETAIPESSDMATGSSHDREVAGKMKAIFDFLVANSHFNRATQHVSYVQSLRAWPDTGSKLRSLLHSVSTTQSRGSLDGLAETWKRLHVNQQAFDKIRTVTQLAEALRLIEKPSKRKAPQSGHIFDRMWTSLAKAEGFGPKTAALFIKAIIDVHTLGMNAELRFLDDFHIDPEDVTRVPVDSVITYIFQHITGKTLDFHAINDRIFDSGLRNDPLPTIWDDLWFWGFITQHGGGDQRRLAINEAKFWSIPGSPKKEWDVIRETAEKFIDILNSPGHLASCASGN